MQLCFGDSPICFTSDMFYGESIMLAFVDTMGLYQR